MHKSLLSVIMAKGGNHNVMGNRFTEETDLLLCVFSYTQKRGMDIMLVRKYRLGEIR